MVVAVVEHMLHFAQEVLEASDIGGSSQATHGILRLMHHVEKKEGWCDGMKTVDRRLKGLLD